MSRELTGGHIDCMRLQKWCGQASVGIGLELVSVSPVAMSAGLINSGECWLLAYNVWLGVLTYALFDFPMWKWFLCCGEHLPCALS